MLNGHPTSQLPSTLLILCGGQGSRLGGIDKGLLQVNGIPFVSRLIQRFVESDGNQRRYRVVISANRNQDQYARLGYPVLADCRANFQGPLAGIEACLHWVSEGPVVIVPADMPALPADLPDRLLARLTGRSIVIAHDGHRQQPLCMALSAEQWLDSLRRCLDQGERSVHKWLADKPLVQVAFGQAAQFCNINNRNDLDAYLKRV